MSRAKDLAKKAMKKEEVEIDEAGEVKTRNKTKKNRMDTARGDLYNKRNKLNIGPGDTGHATRQQSMKALGRALRNEEQIGSGKRTDSSDVANQADAVVKKSPQAGYNKPPAATMPYSTFMNSRPIGSKDKK
jgi:hypothetical protein